MDLDHMLDRCLRLEKRAGALYRSFAANTRGNPRLYALWTRLAAEEDEHARSLVRARGMRDAVAGWRIRLDGWEKALAEVEERLTAAEGLGPGASTDQWLIAAIELETTELDAVRHVVLAVAEQPEPVSLPTDHATAVAEEAAMLSSDPQVGLASALLLARAHLEKVSAGRKPTASHF